MSKSFVYLTETCNFCFAKDSSGPLAVVRTNLAQGQDSRARRRALSSAVRATPACFPGLACVKHPPEAASPLRAPEQTHVARLLFWSDNAGPFRFRELVSWHSSGTSSERPRGAGEPASSLKGGGGCPGFKSPTTCQPYFVVSREGQIKRERRKRMERG